ncbi:MAG: hypothetical protein GF331_25765 [Chitinivibrionales bacterium]|nr:hypothetical protein [Chitinivibrionales bacterium]
MSTHVNIRQLTAEPAIHTYFDVVPESPDTTMVTWFAFEGKPLRRGRVMIAERDGGNAVAVMACDGNPHCGAHQGWLDNEHVFFSADGAVHVANRGGGIVQHCTGAVDTIHQATRRGLAHSNGIRAYGGSPSSEQACYRVDLGSGTMTELLDRATAFAFLADHVDLSGVPEESMNFQHTKWAPDGRQWFVVFANEIWRRRNPDTPRVKVILTADEHGGNLRFIDTFGHHPNWLPDGSGIYAFAHGGRNTVLRWDATGGSSTVLARLPCEGHPCVSPDGLRLVSDGIGWPCPDRCAVVLHEPHSGHTETIHEMDFPVAQWQTLHPPKRICHPHPVWSVDGRRIYFNGIVGDMPRLYVAEMAA